jgi:hypothetical protein
VLDADMGSSDIADHFGNEKGTDRRGPCLMNALYAILPQK